MTELLDVIWIYLGLTSCYNFLIVSAAGVSASYVFVSGEHGYTWECVY